MSVATKTMSVLAATAVFIGLGSLGSTAFADAPAAAATTTQVGSTQGFHITNMSGDPLTLSRVTGAHLDSAPAVGSVLQPGQDADFEIAYASAWDADTIYYTNAQGHTVIIDIGVEGGTIPESRCTSSGGYDCTRAFFHQKYITIADPAGTVHELSGTQAQAEADIAQRLCANNSNATCSFTHEGPVQHTTGPRHLVTWHENSGDKTDVWHVDTIDEQEESNSVDVSVSAGSEFSAFGEKIALEIKTAYGHEWSVKHGYKVGDDIPLDPGQTGYFWSVTPVLRYNGTVTVTMGQTTWELHGVHFDTPDPDGAPGTSWNVGPNKLYPLDPAHQN